MSSCQKSVFVPVCDLFVLHGHDQMSCLTSASSHVGLTIHEGSLVVWSPTGCYICLLFGLPPPPPQPPFIFHTCCLGDILSSGIPYQLYKLHYTFLWLTPSNSFFFSQAKMALWHETTFLPCIPLPPPSPRCALNVWQTQWNEFIGGHRWGTSIYHLCKGTDHQYNKDQNDI